MSILSDGIDDNTEMGFIRYGVSDTRKQVEATKDFVAETDKKVRKANLAKTAPQSFANWQAFVQKWNEFYKTTQGLDGAFNQFRDSTYERTIGFQEKAEKVSEQLDSAKVNSSSIVKQTTSKDGSKNFGLSLPNVNLGLDIPWAKILLWGGISVGGIWIGHKVYKHYTTPQKKVVSFATAEPVATTE